MPAFRTSGIVTDKILSVCQLYYKPLSLTKNESLYFQLSFGLIHIQMIFVTQNLKKYLHVKNYYFLFVSICINMLSLFTESSLN